MPKPYEDYTVAELREKARLKGLNKKVNNFWKLKKAQLIKLLRETKNKKNYLISSQYKNINDLGLRKP